MTDTNFHRHANAAPLRSATALLEAFSPDNRDDTAAGSGARERQTLWDADAIHRAVNLAQMAASLTRLDPARFGLATDTPITAHAETLAAIYAAIGVAGDATVSVPCAPLLQQMSTTLVAMFGAGSGVCVVCRAHDMPLAPDRRRAVLLIASELIINALKYAFGQACDGNLHVTLTASRDVGKLVVEDDGNGIPTANHAGTGSSLVAAMTGLLDGQFQRGRRVSRGTSCSLTFPLRLRNS